MKTLSLSLTVLLGGCLDTAENYYIHENTTVSTSAPLVEDLAARVLYSGFTLSSFVLDGVTHTELGIASSRTPFLCDSSGFIAPDNNFTISSRTTGDLAAGDLIEIGRFDGSLLADDFSLHMIAHSDSIQPLSFEGNIEIVALSAGALSANITARVSAGNLFINTDAPDIPEEATFTLSITDAPLCYVFTY